MMWSSDVNTEQFVSCLLSIWHAEQLANRHPNINCQLSMLTKAIFQCASSESPCPSALPGHLKQDLSWKEELWCIPGWKFQVFFLSLFRDQSSQDGHRGEGWILLSYARQRYFITQQKSVQRECLILLLLFLLLFARFNVSAQTIVSLEKRWV